mmetsp:Transcript_18750/g.50897  ORF Transcript_18750/g.50897 Transcript_18750/m.50897 type:complete len:729 (-) Transcript_18750:249-2435(-)
MDASCSAQGRHGEAARRSWQPHGNANRYPSWRHPRRGLPARRLPLLQQRLLQEGSCEIPLQSPLNLCALDLVHVVDERLLGDHAHQLTILLDHDELDAQLSEHLVHLLQRHLLHHAVDRRVYEAGEVLGVAAGRRPEAHPSALADELAGLHLVLQVLKELVLVNVPDERPVPQPRGPDEGEAAEDGLPQRLEELSDGLLFAIQHLQVLVHHVLRRLVEGALVGLVQVGVAAEPDGAVVDAGREVVPDKLRDEAGAHEGDHHLQPVGELEHDDDERDGHAAHAAKHRGRPDHGVDARVHHDRGAGDHRVDGVRHEAHDAAQARAREEARHEEPRRDPGAEGEGHLHKAQEAGEQERGGEGQVGARLHAIAEAHHVWLRGTRVVAGVEERADGGGREDARVPVGKAGDGREEADQQNLEDLRHPVPPPSALATACAYHDVVVDEDSADQATKDAQDDEADVLGIGRGGVVGRLEERELAGAGWIPPVQGEGCYAGSEEGQDHRARGEHGAHLLEGEEDAAERRAEGDRHASGCRRAQQLPALRLVRAPAGRQRGEAVGPAARDVHERALFAAAEPGADGEAEAHDLRDEGLEGEHAVEGEAAEDGLHLRDPAAPGARRHEAHEQRGDEHQAAAHAHVHRVGLALLRVPDPSAAALLLGEQVVRGTVAKAQAAVELDRSLYERPARGCEDADERRQQPALELVPTTETPMRFLREGRVQGIVVVLLRVDPP